MPYNFVTNIETCHIAVPHLLYYSHIPTAIVALLLGFFVFFKSRKSINNSLAGRLLFFVAILFFLWAIFDIILFLDPDSRQVMFVWSMINLMEMLVSTGTLYFAYVFLEQKDVPLKYKMIIGSLLLPFILLIPTSYNIPGFDIANCEAEQGIMIYYFYALEILFFLWLCVYLIRKIIITQAGERRKVIYFAAGAVLFLASFSGANIVGSLTEQWTILQYGLFGMPVFMGFLAYLIVQYKVFNIQLVSAQALVFAITLLVGSQFFFVRNPVNVVLTAVTFVLIVAFGWWLVRSVKQEIKQREQMEQLARELAEANRKRERINKQLEKANVQLKKLDEAKSEFISIASHQLRTPLTAIKGYGSMLLEGDFGEVKEPKQKDAIEKMFISNNRLISLVENLLNVSRIESGRLKFDFKAQPLEALVEEVYNNLLNNAKNAGLYLKLDKPAKPLPNVYMDDEKIRQVVINFIDNAIKYTREGGIIVHLYAKGKDVVCKVEDTGMGISPDEQKRLFQKFTRGKDAFTVNTEGTGLGLYVAHMMVASHKGKIWIESEGEGKGSKFCFSLPVATGKEKEVVGEGSLKTEKSL